MDKIIQYILVRKDLNMSTGKVASQVAHASLASVYPYLNDESVKEWLGGQFTKVILSVKNFQQLNKVSIHLTEVGIVHAKIWDSALTEIQRETENGTLTCIGLIPRPKSLLIPYIGKLQLY